MQHTIDQGNELFKDTPFKDTWMINSDRLAAWWEVAEGSGSGHGPPVTVQTEKLCTFFARE
eukprot:7376972-Prymnesium_polylepis.1